MDTINLDNLIEETEDFIISTMASLSRCGMHQTTQQQIPEICDKLRNLAYEIEVDNKLLQLQQQQEEVLLEQKKQLLQKQCVINSWQTATKNKDVEINDLPMNNESNIEKLYQIDDPLQKNLELRAKVQKNTEDYKKMKQTLLDMKPKPKTHKPAVPLKHKMTQLHHSSHYKKITHKTNFLASDSETTPKSTVSSSSSSPLSFPPIPSTLSVSSTTSHTSTILATEKITPQIQKTTSYPSSSTPTSTAPIIIRVEEQEEANSSPNYGSHSNNNQHELPQPETSCWARLFCCCCKKKQQYTNIDNNGTTNNDDNLNTRTLTGIYIDSD